MARSLGPLIMIALASAACGGGAASAPEPSTSVPTPAPIATVARTSSPPGTSAPLPTGTAVTVRGSAFEPVALEVRVGTTVIWTNLDGTTHTTTSGVPGVKDGRWDQQLAGPGGTFAFTFTQPGTFTYYCAFHSGSMFGRVVVK